jgi:hypothetical protein
MVNRQEFGVALTATSATPAVVIEDGLPPLGPLAIHPDLARLFRRPLADCAL